MILAPGGGHVLIPLRQRRQRRVAAVTSRLVPSLSLSLSCLSEKEMCVTVTELVVLAGSVLLPT